MAYKNTIYNSTAGLKTKDIGFAVEDMKNAAKNRRRIMERRWYDNNFFDDGFHFRYLSRGSNKIVDLSERSTIYTPQRAIPKASRQIRGVANLLMSSDPTPTVYPDAIDKKSFVNPQAFEQEQERLKDLAQKKGLWLLKEWRTPDESEESVLDKFALILLLSMKHSVAYMKIWPDFYEEKINSSVRDAFDVYTFGHYTSIHHTPFMIDSVPMLISDIKSIPIFDKDQLEQINPDNKKASSEIKEAYMQSRYGRDVTSEEVATLILNDCFLRENISDKNLPDIRRQENGEQILKKIQGESDDFMGKPIFRHAFTAGGVWLYDEYTDLLKYPYVDYRMEPGPIYQVPLIERFMPANKSLDSIVSRIERYTHTMVTGSWLKRRGENFKLNNIAGGQVIEYDATPPTQNQIAPIPPFVYEFVSLLTNFIEEQGVSTTTLGKLPSGVRANAAIESLKESEYANLIIATRRFNSFTKKVARTYFEIADEHFVTPHRMIEKVKGNVFDFSVIGATALKKRKKLKVETQEDLVPLSKDTNLDIEVEQGMAYTKEGQKATMQEVMNTFIQAVQVKAIPATALQSVYKKYLEIYQFGATEEFMDDFDEAMKQGTPMNDQQLMQMKVAVLEAMKEAGEVGPEASQKRVMENKVGALEALQQSGLAKKIMGEPVKESVALNYKDVPEDIKRQMEAKAGFRPSRQVSPTVTDQMLNHAKTLTELRKPDTEVQKARLLAQRPQGGESNGQQSNR